MGNAWLDENKLPAPVVTEAERKIQATEIWCNKRLEEMKAEYEKNLTQIKEYMAEKIDEFLKFRGDALYDQVLWDVYNIGPMNAKIAMVKYLAQIHQECVDKIVNNAFLNTATDTESVNRLAALIGPPTIRVATMTENGHPVEWTNATPMAYDNQKARLVWELQHKGVISNGKFCVRATSTLLSVFDVMMWRHEDHYSREEKWSLVRHSIPTAEEAVDVYLELSKQIEQVSQHG